MRRRKPRIGHEINMWIAFPGFVLLVIAIYFASHYWRWAREVDVIVLSSSDGTPLILNEEICGKLVDMKLIVYADQFEDDGIDTFKPVPGLNESYVFAVASREMLACRLPD